MVAKKPLYPDDRRKAPRFTVGHTAWIVAPRSLAGTIDDLSATGLRFTAVGPPLFEPGEKVRVVFQLDAREPSLKLDAVVVRHEGALVMGVDFADIFPFERQAITRFVAARGSAARS
jgi:hypothetical protein